MLVDLVNIEKMGRINLNISLFFIVITFDL